MKAPSSTFQLSQHPDQGHPRRQNRRGRHARDSISQNRFSTFNLFALIFKFDGKSNTGGKVPNFPL